MLPWLGALTQSTSRASLGTSVLTPTMRYHPSVVAQAFGTIACLAPGRVFLGVGTGEAMNETPPTGSEWPGANERRLRLRESIELMRRLWTEERVNSSLEHIMVKSFHDVDQVTKKYGVSMRIAAYILSIDRVATVYRLRGVFA